MRFVHAPHAAARVAAMGAVALLFLLLMAGYATAVEVESSSRDHLDGADLRVRLAATDPTGTVMLLVDDTVVRAAPGVPGQSLDFGVVGLLPGSHEVVARVTGRDASAESQPLALRVWGRPLPAMLVRPGEYAAQRSSAAVRVGLSTTKLDVYLNGRLLNSRAVLEGTLAGMGLLELAPGVNTVKLVSSNPVASTTSTFKVRRLQFPWPTCIVIDKSEFKLYWVRNGVLVKAYPIAVGKAHSPTPAAVWRIDAKYHTDPRGVYGPRKMRLFRQTAHGYAYTAYAIHGTNQPWVIGTQASAGCVRLNNRDILELFPQVPLGTMVQTRE